MSVKNDWSTEKSYDPDALGDLAAAQNSTASVQHVTTVQSDDLRVGSLLQCLAQLVLNS